MASDGNRLNLAVDRLLDARYREQLPDLEALLVALKCHRELRSRRARSLHEVAASIGMNKDSLYRRLSKFDEAMGELFRGRAEIGKPDADPLFDKIEFLANFYDGLIFRDVLRIRLGASQTLARMVVPEVVKPFIDRCQEARKSGRIDFDVVVDLTSGLPKDLRDLCEGGELDLVMCSCEDDYREGKRGVVTRIDLPLRLVFPRDRKDLARLGDLRQGSGVLADKTLVVLRDLPGRKPLPKYPEWALSEAREVRQVDTYLDMLNLVKSGEDLVAFSFEELLDTDEQEALKTLPLGEGRWSLPVCLIRSEVARALRSQQEVDVLKDLEESFRLYMRDRLERGEFLAETIDQIKRTTSRSVYHVRKIAEGGSPKDWIWCPGSMSLELTKMGYVRGSHVVQALTEGEDYVFRIDGRALRNRLSRSGDCHLVWHARTQSGPGDDREVYVASFVCDLGDLVEGRLVGAWAGRTTTRPTEYRQSVGYIVVVPAPLEGTPAEVAGQLNAMVESHAGRFGGLGLITPEDFDPGRGGPAAAG